MIPKISMTPDERAGATWWNALTDRERVQRLTLAVGFGLPPTVAECWRHYKIVRDNAHLDKHLGQA